MNEFDKRSSKYTKKKKENLPVTTYDIIDDTLLNLFCSYIFSKNTNVHKFSISSLKRLLDAITIDGVPNNPVLKLKYQFIQYALNDRIDGLSDKDLILHDVNQHMDTSTLLQDPKFIRELSTKEINYIENSIGVYLNTLAFDRRISSFIGVCKNYLNADFRTKLNSLSGVQEYMNETMTEFRKNDAASDNSSTLFRLSSMNDSMEDIHKYITNPSYKLVTGMQGMNAMLGGGFQKTRVYCFFGMAGEGKTVTLVNLLYQVWKYNKGFKTKDPTKRPCIVLLTMENLVIEYINALYHVITRGGNLKNCSSAEEAINEFKAKNFEYNGDNGIELVIKYKPVNSVDTSYMYKITEKLEDEGFETIAFFMDYLMRIRPSEYTRDPYQDLGTVVNDFKTFAALKDVPVITASQLNREAARIIDEGRSSNQANLIRKLGRANIGDSVQIDRNLDGTIILVPEVSSTGEKYMAFKLTKHRYEIYTNKVSIYQPFYPESKIALVEDVYEARPAFKESLARDAEEIREAFGDVNRVSINKTIRSLEGLTSTSKMMNPGIVKEVKKEDTISFPASSLIKPELKEVATIIPKQDRDRLRKTYVDIIE